MPNDTPIRWFEILDAAQTEDLEIPFECEGDAVIVRAAGSAFISFARDEDIKLAQSAVTFEPVSPAKVAKLALEEKAPRASDLAQQRTERPVGLGDRVSRLLSWLGFSSCASCDNRRSWLNSLSLKLRLR